MKICHSFAFLFLLAACAPQQLGQKASSVEDYCYSGPGLLARSIVGVRDKLGRLEETAWAMTEISHASVIAASPREREAMRKVVRFVYEHPELDADGASAAAYSECLRERNEGRWWAQK